MTCELSLRSLCTGICATPTYCVAIGSRVSVASSSDLLHDAARTRIRQPHARSHKPERIEDRSERSERSYMFSSFCSAILAPVCGVRLVPCAASFQPFRAQLSAFSLKVHPSAFCLLPLPKHVPSHEQRERDDRRRDGPDAEERDAECHGHVFVRRSEEHT